MARTKQTARKSTGGRAPRRQLAGSYRGRLPLHRNYGKHPSPPRQQLIFENPVISDTVSHAGISSAAQETVFSTPDVLVIILSQLPHSSLLKAQRVNKTWASLFKHVEIQAALFRHPRPRGSALYVEAHSDILKNEFSAFWPINGEDRAVFSKINSTLKTFHHEEGVVDGPVDASDGDGISEIPLQNKCPYSQQWRDLLVCQPTIEALELVQEVNRRGGGDLEFRTVIHRPGGLRMGFLYDAVRHWHEVECSSADLLWNRMSGDLTHRYQTYIDGPGFQEMDDKPCLTIRGWTSVGCGQYGGLTYNIYQSAQRTQVIRSGDEEVEYCMSEPQHIGWDWSCSDTSIKQDIGNKENKVA